MSAEERLWKGAQRGDEAMARAALEEGADIDAADPYGWSASMHAAVSGDAKILRMLLAAGAKTEGKVYPQGWTPLMGAALEGNAEAARELVAHGADLEAMDRDGKTALHCACQNGSEAVARILLEAGADWSAQDMAGQSAEEAARMHGRSECLDLMRRWRIASEEKEQLGKGSRIAASSKGARL